jgi:hypothetical protein
MKNDEMKSALCSTALRLREGLKHPYCLDGCRSDPTTDVAYHNRLSKFNT